MGKEASILWTRRLKPILKKYKWDYQRLEDKTAEGIPDVNIHVPGLGDVWIELKLANKGLERLLRTPKHLGKILQPAQYLWLRNGYNAGRMCVVLGLIDNNLYAWYTPEGWKGLRDDEPWGRTKCLGVPYINVSEFLGDLPTRFGPERWPPSGPSVGK